MQVNTATNEAATAGPQSAGRVDGPAHSVVDFAVPLTALMVVIAFGGVDTLYKQRWLYLVVTTFVAATAPLGARGTWCRWRSIKEIATWWAWAALAGLFVFR